MWRSYPPEDRGSRDGCRGVTYPNFAATYRWLCWNTRRCGGGPAGARRRGRSLDAVGEGHVLEDGGVPHREDPTDEVLASRREISPGVHRSTRGSSTAAPRAQRRAPGRVHVSSETFTAKVPRELIAHFINSMTAFECRPPKRSRALMSRRGTRGARCIREWVPPVFPTAGYPRERTFVRSGRPRFSCAGVPQESRTSYGSGATPWL